MKTYSYFLQQQALLFVWMAVAGGAAYYVTNYFGLRNQFTPSIMQIMGFAVTFILIGSCIKYFCYKKKINCLD